MTNHKLSIADIIARASFHNSFEEEGVPEQPNNPIKPSGSWLHDILHLNDVVCGTAVSRPRTSSIHTINLNHFRSSPLEDITNNSKRGNAKRQNSILYDSGDDEIR
jgi:hypothetical protein